MRVGLLSLVLCAAAYPARAQNVSPQQRQAILDYQLTLPAAEHLITAMQAMTSYLISLPDYQDRIRKSAAMTGAERVAQLEGDPKAAAILKQNSLTARLSDRSPGAQNGTDGSAGCHFAEHRRVSGESGIRQGEPRSAQTENGCGRRPPPLSAIAAMELTVVASTFRGAGSDPSAIR